MTWAWPTPQEKEDESAHFMTKSLDDKYPTHLPIPSITPVGIGHNPIVSEDMPYHTPDSLLPHESDHRSRWSLQTTLVTSTSQNIAWPENSSASYTTPTPLASDGYPLPSVTNANGHSNHPNDHFEARPKPPVAVAVILPVAILAIIGAVVFICLRKRRKQKQIAAIRAKTEEMRSRSLPTTQAYVTSPLPTAQPSSRSTPLNGLSPTMPMSPQPVILGPILGSNNNYFTGIDTFDIVSVQSHERSGLGDPFADSNSIQDEPPPPYYPRSIIPMTRNTSSHEPYSLPVSSSQTELIGVPEQATQSPFDDPRNDDEISDVSGYVSRRTGDNMSTVSDLSYQHDSVVRRQNI
jgi:hypothetical protein